MVNSSSLNSNLGPDPIHELIALAKREKGKRTMNKWTWIFVAVVVGYVLGAMYPQWLAKAKGIAGA